MAISTEWHLGCPLLVDCYAAPNDFPHSKQFRFPRGVMRPQNGHILCGAKPSSGSLTLSRFFAQASPKSSRRRTRTKNESFVHISRTRWGSLVCLIDPMYSSPAEWSMNLFSGPDCSNTHILSTSKALGVEVSNPSSDGGQIFYVYSFWENSEDAEKHDSAALPMLTRVLGGVMEGALRVHPFGGLRGRLSSSSSPDAR